MNQIDRYVIVSELGRGATGVVYRAFDPTIDREVALKVLSLGITPEEGSRSPADMFMREVRAAGRLTHPSIVVIHDAFNEPDNQHSCIVMELVRGRTLEKIMVSDNPLTNEQYFSVIRQVADGLDYAHRNNVIHRDLKPANIMVTEDGRAKITDFGIAKVLARESVARTIGIMGTPAYMSPEQVRGGAIDARTDIFSLGIIIYNIVTGQKPFVGNTAAVMFKIVYEEPTLPSSLNPLLTSAHDHIIKKCLAKEREQRYYTARELLNDLEDLQHGRPLRSLTAAPAHPAPPPAAAPPFEGTVAAPIPSVKEEVAKPPSPRPTPAAPPISARPSSVAGARPPQRPAPPAVSPQKPATPPLKAAIPLPGSPAPPAARPLTGPPPRAPQVSAAPPKRPSSPPPSFPPPASPVAEAGLPTQVVGISGVPPGAEVQSIPPAATYPAEAPQWTEAPETAAAVPTAPKSKLFPAIVAALAIVFLVVAGLAFWTIRKTRTKSAPPAPVVAQSLPTEAPIPASAPEAAPAPEAAATPVPAASVSTAPIVPKKSAIRKPKAEAKPQPAAPEPPPAEPAPVTPAPAPTPVSPTPAPAPAAPKFADVPRIVQVSCNFGLKEATFTFSSAHQTLYEESFKGKKEKGGFLGMKGSYSGTFTHTIVVPAAGTEVSLHVVTKEKGADLTKTIPMPPRGGFVPTLVVEVASDHLSMSWKQAAGAK